MADNQHLLNARIRLKSADWSEWDRVKGTFKPLRGEVIIYFIPAHTTETGLMPPAVGIKVGNGKDVLQDLPWIQAAAGDVYSWAKKEHGIAADITSTILKNNIGNSSASAEETASVQEVLTYLTGVVGTLTGGEGADESVSGKILAALKNLALNDNAVNGQFITEVDQSNGVISVTRRALTTDDIPNLPASKITGADTIVQPDSNNLITSGAVATAISGLTSAMHFKGAVASLPDATATTTFNTYESGDVVLGPNDKEYVYKKGNDAASSSWIELGGESSFALNTISITGDDGLTGGGILTGDRTISHDIPENASEGTKGTAGGRQYIQTLTTDKFGHVTNATFASETVTDTTYTLTWNNKAAASDAEKLILTPNSGTTQKLDLKTVATTGNIYDLENALSTQNPPVDNGEIRTAKYFILDCGDATHLVDALS